MKTIYTILCKWCPALLEYGRKKYIYFALATPVLLIGTAVVNNAIPDTQVLLFSGASMAYFYCVSLICRFYIQEVRRLAS